MPEAWAGHTVGELANRRVYHVNVLGVRHEGSLDVEITPKTVLQADDSILLLGAQESMNKLMHI